MDAERTLFGALTALLGAVGGYLLRWRQEGRTRRELRLLRLLHRKDSAGVTRDLESRYAALRREHGDD